MRLVAAIASTMAILVLSGVHASAQRDIRIDTEILHDADGVHPGASTKTALKAELEHGFHVNSVEPLESFLIPTTLTVEGPEGISVTQLAYPEAKHLEFPFSDGPMAVYEEQFAIGALLSVADTVTPGEYPVQLKLRYQACNDKQCYAPQTKDLETVIRVVAPGEPIQKQNEEFFHTLRFNESTPLPDTPDQPESRNEIVEDISIDELVARLNEFEIRGTAAGFLPVDDFVQFLDDAEAGVVRGNVLEGKAPLAVLALVIVGGLALNLTPCVLPLIPINLAIIGAGAQAGSKTRGFLLGGAYGLSMALVYGALGLLVVLTGATFGTINSTIWFNAGIAVLFVVLGLAMFDVIQIDFSRFQSKLNVAGTARKGTFLLAFGMGGVAALLAGACVAPMVIWVLIYSSDLYTEGTTIALALPFFLGLGMALPWPFAGAGMSFLPKPGPWMVRVKQAMGVFILAFAAYYAYLAWEIYDSRNVDPAAVAASVRALEEEGWTPSLAQGLAQAREEDRYVLVDMWATWCKSCLTMDKTTLRDPAVEARLEDYVKVKFQAEDPGAPDIKPVFEFLDAKGLPTYAVLRPKSSG